MIKKKFKRAGVCLLVGALAITSAYAWLKASETAQKTNVIKAGVIKVHFDNGQNVISLADNDAIPMTNEYANNNLIKYTFDVLNDGEIDVDYTLYAVNEDGSTLDTELIMLQLNDEAPITLKDAKLVELKTLSAGDRDTYTLLAYINENATTEQAVNLKTLKFHLELKAVQKGAPLVDLSNINSGIASGDFSVMGNLVTIDNKQYRVLGVEGTQATVISMEKYASNKYYGSVNADFEDITVAAYVGGIVDNYLNTTVFNSFSPELQNAIVPQNVKQSVYEYNTWEVEEDTYHSTSENQYGTIQEISLTRKGEIEIGQRYVYALDIDDLIKYFGKSPAPRTLQKFFYNTEESQRDSFWMRSTSTNSPYVYVYTGLNKNTTTASRTSNTSVRPMFVIDLSKLYN